jgi:5-methylcytosine-specific restriction endonuclease McrA
MKGKKRSRYTSKGMTLRELWLKHNGVCQGCSRHISMCEATRDHKRPKSRGGSNKRKNLQLLCYSCNQIKGNSWVTQ